MTSVSRRRFLGGAASTAAGFGAVTLLGACRKPGVPPAPPPPTLQFVRNAYTTSLADPNHVKQINGRRSTWSHHINWSAAGAYPPVVNDAAAQAAKRVDHVSAGVHAADMGVMWDDGLGRVITTFGDSFGSGWTGPFATRGSPSEYRHNTGARSSNRDLTRGVLFDSWLRRGYQQDPYAADRLVTPGALGRRLKSRTPTAGCSIPYGSGRAQVMLVSMVEHYENATAPTGVTAFSTIVWSPDGGETWHESTGAADAPVWSNDGSFSSGFQHGAFVVGDDGYLYWFGTRNTGPTGAGAVCLARVPASVSSVVRRSRWTYWNGSAWVADGTQAVAVVPPPADLITVRWNAHLKCWLMMFVSHSPYGQYLGWRTARDLVGPWSAISSMAVPSLGTYCPQIHPWSTGPDLYVSVTMRDAYAVFLLHARIANPAA